MREPRRILTTLQACDEAASLLKMAGFEVAYVSMQSESVYYQFPGREGVIRVASHSGGNLSFGQKDKVLARLTFLPHKLSKIPDTLVIGEQRMADIVCAAIGRYMIASNRGTAAGIRRWQTPEDASL